MPIGHIGNYMKTVPFLPLGTGQILGGLHLIMIVLTTLYVDKPGASTMAGAVKGLVEAALFSYHGIQVVLMSAIQGLVIDTIYNSLGRSKSAMYIGCGLSAGCTILYIQFFLLKTFPLSVYIFMYALSLVSGVVLGGFTGLQLYQMVEKRVQ